MSFDEYLQTKEFELRRNQKAEQQLVKELNAQPKMETNSSKVPEVNPLLPLNVKNPSLVYIYTFLSIIVLELAFVIAMLYLGVFYG